MPNFKKNPSPAMKRSGFKMKGYSYPGTSPVMKSTEPTEITDSTTTTTVKPVVVETKNDPFEYEKILIDEQSKGKKLSASEKRLIGRYREHLHKSKS